MTIDRARAIGWGGTMGKVLVVLALLAFGCGSSDDGGSSPGSQCDDLLNASCNRGADCIAQLACDPGYTREQEFQSCLTAARQALACGKAKAVGPSYSACMKATESADCSAYGTSAQCTVPTLPADCKGVILF